EYDSVHEDDPRRLAALHNAYSAVNVEHDACMWAQDVGFEDIGDLVKALRDSAVYYDVKARIARQLKALKRAEEILGKTAGEKNHERARSRGRNQGGEGNFRSPRAKTAVGRHRGGMRARRG